MILLDLGEKEIQGKFCEKVDNKLVVKSKIGKSLREYFSNWENEVNNKPKKDYIRNFNFKYKEESERTGSIKNCYPMFNLNRDKVFIYFDFYSLNKKL